jgi:hypothetical protein
MDALRGVQAQSCFTINNVVKNGVTLVLTALVLKVLKDVMDVSTYSAIMPNGDVKWFKSISEMNEFECQSQMNKVLSLYPESSFTAEVVKLFGGVKGYCALPEIPDSTKKFFVLKEPIMQSDVVAPIMRISDDLRNRPGLIFSICKDTLENNPTENNPTNEHCGYMTMHKIAPSVKSDQIGYDQDDSWYTASTFDSVPFDVEEHKMSIAKLQKLVTEKRLPAQGCHEVSTEQSQLPQYKFPAVKLAK